MPPLPESKAMKTIMVAALLCTNMLDASPAVSLPLVRLRNRRPFAPRRAPDEGPVHFPDDRSAQTLVLRSIRWDRCRAMQTHVLLRGIHKSFACFPSGFAGRKTVLRMTTECLARQSRRMTGSDLCYERATRTSD